jgi:hypothetical protein
MEKNLTLKIDLEIPAKRLLQHISFENKGIEEQVEQGIKEAIETLTKDGNIKDMVKREVIHLFNTTVLDHTIRWDLETRIRKVFDQSLEQKIKEYADSIANEIMSKIETKL